jgi:hypothetical protein
MELLNANDLLRRFKVHKVVQVAVQPIPVNAVSAITPQEPLELSRLSLTEV